MSEFDEFSFAYVDPLQKDEENKLEAEDEFSFAYGEPVTQTDQEVKEPEDEFAFAYGEQSEEQKNYPTKVKSYQAFVESPQIREQAVRFARDRLGYDDISPEDAVEEVIEHFRDVAVPDELAAAARAAGIGGAVVAARALKIILVAILSIIITPGQIILAVFVNYSAGAACFPDSIAV